MINFKLYDSGIIREANTNTLVAYWDRKFSELHLNGKPIITNMDDVEVVMDIVAGDYVGDEYYERGHLIRVK